MRTVPIGIGKTPLCLKRIVLPLLPILRRKKLRNGSVNPPPAKPAAQWVEIIIKKLSASPQSYGKAYHQKNSFYIPALKKSSFVNEIPTCRIKSSFSNCSKQGLFQIWKKDCRYRPVCPERQHPSIASVQIAGSSASGWSSTGYKKDKKKTDRSVRMIGP